MKLNFDRLKAKSLTVFTIVAMGLLSACSTGGNTSGTAAINPLSPYAGTFYPVYNQGVGSWIEPTESMPFNKVGMIFIAFAHTYPANPGAESAVLSWEHGQDAESARVLQLNQIARSVNPNIKILVSLGWEHLDWDYITSDYVSGYNNFPKSVVAFVRENKLDGFDIDDEGIEETPGSGSGSITQPQFDAVIQNLRSALDQAGHEDGKYYYLTITPAGTNYQSPTGIENTQVDNQNMNLFDLINVQSYYDNGETSPWGDQFVDQILAVGYPESRLAVGIDSKDCNNIAIPANYSHQMAGIFNWTMSSDSVCGNFATTYEIAQTVGY